MLTRDKNLHIQSLRPESYKPQVCAMYKKYVLMFLLLKYLLTNGSGVFVVTRTQHAVVKKQTCYTLIHNKKRCSFRQKLVRSLKDGENTRSVGIYGLQ